MGSYYYIDLRSETWVCGRSLAGIVGSNPAAGMDVFLVCVVSCQVEKYLRHCHYPEEFYRMWCV
jgi:hypothetical protein